MWYLIVSIPDLCTLTYFTEAQQALSGQTLKAIFMLNKYIRKFVSLKPQHILDLFDKLIRPILTYSAEVWGLTTSMITERVHLQISGHWLDMVYLPQGNFVDHIFREAQRLARILQHVSPLTIAAFSCNSLLYMLPYKIFDN